MPAGQQDVEARPDIECPACHAPRREYCSSAGDVEVFDTEGFYVHRSRLDAARAASACPCSTTGCARRGCQCPCPDCTRVREERAAEDTAECTRCGVARPLSDYATRSSNGRRQSWCRDCHAAHARERRASGATAPRRTRESVATVLDSRTYGVEIETVTGLSCQEVAQAIDAAGVACTAPGYSHAVLRTWKVVPDGSVCGVEVVSPILSGEEGKREVRRVMRVLRDLGCGVNRTTGLHVHHDITDLSAAQIAHLARLWYGEQPAIDGLVAQSRHGGGYCRYLTASDLAEVDRWAQSCGATPTGYPSVNRYRTLNLTSFMSYGTVEIRQHQGTLNATKTLAWIEFGQAMIERAKAGAPCVDNVAVRDVLAACETAGLRATTAEYLTERADILAGGRAVA